MSPVDRTDADFLHSAPSSLLTEQEASHLYQHVTLSMYILIRDYIFTVHNGPFRISDSGNISELNVAVVSCFNGSVFIYSNKRHLEEIHVFLYTIHPLFMPTKRGFNKLMQFFSKPLLHLSSLILHC